MTISMEDRDGLIWMDGKLVPWREAKVHLLSYTFQHGAGFFEGVRCYDGEAGLAVFRLSDHVRRFYDSARILQMPIRIAAEKFAAAHLDVIRANNLGSCYLRPVGYYDGRVVGVSAAGNEVHAAIAAWEWNAYLGDKAMQDGIRVKTSSYCRHHVNAVMGKAKANGHYVNSMMAVMEARQLGYQDALMLDGQGYVAECSTSNIFLVRGGQISTPDTTAILEGITRNTVMVMAQEAGLDLAERRITRDELYCADEIFVTGTAAEITPVVELDGRAIGSGVPGPITREMQASYQAAVEGRAFLDKGWLTPV